MRTNGIRRIPANAPPSDVSNWRFSLRLVATFSQATPSHSSATGNNYSKTCQNTHTRTFANKICQFGENITVLYFWVLTPGWEESLPLEPHTPYKSRRKSNTRTNRRLWMALYLLPLEPPQTISVRKEISSTQRSHLCFAFTTKPSLPSLPPVRLCLRRITRSLLHWI